MKAPEKIYLQACGSCNNEMECKECQWKDLVDNVTWCEDKIFDRDIEYIRKDALLEWVVEGEVTTDNRGNNVVRAGVFNKDFEYGDKVRIVILKDNEDESK